MDAKPLKKPTSRQLEALEHIRWHWQQWQCSPTVAELADAMGITRHPAHELINALFDCDLLERIKQNRRNFKLTARALEILGE